MAQYDTITINNIDFPRPVNFLPMREDVYASEYRAMSGAVRADRVGWKYADMELKWDALPQDLVYALTTLVGSFNITFDDPQGMRTTLARRMSTVAMRHRYQQDGVYYWKDVSVKISFLGMYKQTNAD